MKIMSLLIVILLCLNSAAVIAQTGSNDGGGITPFVCGKDIVSYQGKIYHTIMVAKQCWLKENLDAGKMVTATKDTSSDGIIKKYCYGNKPENCEIYGALYQWNEAMKYASAEMAQGICPEGFHIPSKSEFEILKIAVNENSNLLKCIGQGFGDGAGTDSTSFSAMLGGYRGYFSGTCASLGAGALFWTSTEYNAESTIDVYITDETSRICFDDNYKTNAFSVRCIKNK